MIYIESSSHDPRFNLALEQYVFDEMSKEHEYFMFWRNEKSVIIGKNQNTFAEINHKFIRKNNIDVVRRLSGGGTVYHDLGNLNFTYVTDDETKQLDLRKFCMPLVKALEVLGIKAEISGRNDITIDGRKFSGSAQYKSNGRVMHHGTIMFDVNLQDASSALNVADDKMAAKGVKSVRSRVVNIYSCLKEKIDINKFKEILLSELFSGEPLNRYIFSDADLKRINEIKQSRYDLWEWNYGNSPVFEIRKRRRIEGCGTVEAAMNIKHGIIEDIKFYGDFFGNGDISDIEFFLKGKKAEYNEVLSVLASCDIEQYFANLSPVQLAEIILE